MKIYATNDLTSEFLTIEIYASQKEWQFISDHIFQDETVIKTNLPQENSSNQIDPHVEALKGVKINLDNSGKSTEFDISLINSMLIIQGSKKSLIKLKDVAEDFAKNHDKLGDHVHIDYIDFEGYEYNWFSNKNIDLILAVREDF
jgi:hypothetical protein